MRQSEPTRGHGGGACACGQEQDRGRPCALRSLRETARPDGVVLYDQVNTRYAVDSTNMQIWSTHSEVRYVYVPTEGRVRLFELGGNTVLSDSLPGIDEVLPSVPFLYFRAGDRQAKDASAWAAKLRSPRSYRCRGHA